jgi:hypothetical protein
VKYLLVLALLVAPSMAAAQSDVSTAETRALMHAYARCVVGAQPARASEAILRNADNSTILREYRRLIVPECLSREVKQTTEMRFGGDLYRYALADALVRRELAVQPVPDFDKVPRLTHREAGAQPTPIAANGKRLSKRKYEAALKSYHEDVGYSFLSKYGECVVRVDPANSKALLMATPDSAPEAVVFKALQPALATCLAEGQTLTFGKVALRGTIAINYYRLAHAARGRLQ